MVLEAQLSIPHQSHIHVILCHPIIAIVILVAVITFIFILVMVTLCSVHNCANALFPYPFILPLFSFALPLVLRQVVKLPLELFGATLSRYTLDPNNPDELR